MTYLRMIGQTSRSDVRLLQTKVVDAFLYQHGLKGFIDGLQPQISLFLGPFFISKIMTVCSRNGAMLVRNCPSPGIGRRNLYAFTPRRPGSALCKSNRYDHQAAVMTMWTLNVEAHYWKQTKQITALDLSQNARQTPCF